MDWNSFLNSNFPSTLATILAAFVAYFIYRISKADTKRDIAKLILQEIRYAEKQIKIARERGNVFLLTNKLLPTNSWYGSIHLFVNDLEQTDRDSISDFYSKVGFLDKVISKIAEFKTGQIIEQSGVAQPGATQQIQLSAEIILKEVTDQIEFLYSTSAGDRLRDIAERKR